MKPSFGDFESLMFDAAKKKMTNKIWNALLFVIQFVIKFAKFTVYISVSKPTPVELAHFHIRLEKKLLLSDGR